MGRVPHRYTLLAWSDASGERTAHVADAKGLTTRACLRFLVDIPSAAKVYGYYLGYDWTKIFADLPDKDIYLLMRPELRIRPKDEGGGFSPVRYRGYKIHWLAGMVRISRGKRSVTIWDVGRFYQGPFVVALKDAGIGGADIEKIEEMKARRSEFSESESANVLEYCLLECRYLAQLVEQLNEAHRQAGLSLRTWYGPGSAASVALKKMGIAKKRGSIPDAMRIPVACAFFGGRFEHATIGRVAGPIYSYDIVSAYPAQLVELPCLEHACWRYTTDARDIQRAEQALVAWELTDSRSKRAWGPLPVRLPNGSIVFPSRGATGWCWLDEFKAALAWSQVRFVGAYVLERECDCRPFALISELFETRQRVGRKTAVGGALKRTYNSCYGKLAQVVGDPPFRSQVWAGMITSGTRAMLLGPIAVADDAILAVATDGIYSTEPLDLDIGERLGQWEADEPYEDIVLVRPGIYWTGDKVRSRGLPRKTVGKHQAAILRALESGASRAELPPIDQFGAAGACVYRLPSGVVKRAPRYGEWYERPARISFDPRPKRRPDWGLWELPDVESRPYAPGLVSPDALALRIAETLSALC